MIFGKSKKVLFHASPFQGLTNIEPRETTAYKKLGKVVFASSVPQFAACFGARWLDSDATIGVTHSEDNDMPKENNVQEVLFTVINKGNVDLYSKCSMYVIQGYFDYLDYENSLEQFSRGVCVVVEEKRFNTFKEMLQHYGTVLK